MTDKQQPPAVPEGDGIPERLFAKACHPERPNQNCSWTLSKEPVEGGIPYARVHPVDDAQVKRYSLDDGYVETKGVSYPNMEEDEHGEYVRYEDYVRLLPQLSSSERRCGECDKLARVVEHYFETDPAEQVAEWCKASATLRQQAQTIIATTGAGKDEQRDKRFTEVLASVISNSVPTSTETGNNSHYVVPKTQFDTLRSLHREIAKGLWGTVSPVPVAEGEPQKSDGWVTFGRVKVDIENETETFERIHPPAHTAAPVVESPQDTVKLTPWISADDRVWERYANITCVECPDCCFRFDAIHQDGDTLGYSCPNCKDRPASTVTSTEAASEIVQEWVAGLDYGSLPPGQISRLTELVAKHPSPTEATQLAVERAHDLPVSVTHYQTATRVIGLLDGWREQDTFLCEWDSKEEMTEAVAAIISKHCAAKAGEAERLRGILREQRKTIKHWQRHVLTTSRLLRCGAITDEVEAAISKLRQDLAESRTNIISECVEIVNNASVLPFNGVPYISRDEVLANLRALTKGEHQE